MKILIPLIGLVVVLGAVLLYQAAFTVHEFEQALVFQFGRIERVVTEPGLYWKKPFIQKTRYYEKRVLEYDSDPRSIITEDKKTLRLDNFARWRIIDPELFYNSVVDETGGQARLDDIIYSELRTEVGRAELIEVIRTEMTEEMNTNRRAIMDQVTQACDEKTRRYGIEVLDVRIKRADLPKENEEAVYNRMRAERQRIADRFKAEGQEEAFKIEAEADKQKTIIAAEAYRKSQEIRGQGDAEALRIYAEAFQQDPDFYSLLRTLEAYEKTLGSETTLVLSTDSDFFRFFSEVR